MHCIPDTAISYHYKDDIEYERHNANNNQFDTLLIRSIAILQIVIKLQLVELQLVYNILLCSAYFFN